MRVPRRPAVLLSALALTGSVAACAADDGAGADTGTQPGVEQPAPGGGTDGDETTGDEPIGDVTVPQGG